MHMSGYVGGTLSFSDAITVQRTINSMHEELRLQVREIPPMEWIAARRFLEGLENELTMRNPSLLSQNPDFLPNR